jgi:hypothetical protein
MQLLYASLNGSGQPGGIPDNDPLTTKILRHTPITSRLRRIIHRHATTSFCLCFGDAEFFPRIYFCFCLALRHFPRQISSAERSFIRAKEASNLLDSGR